MQTHRAYTGSIFTDNHMATIAANPYRIAFAREHDAFFDVLQQSTIAFFMMTLYRSHGAETKRYFGEAFFFGFTSHSVVHIGPFVIFAGSSFTKIGHSIGNVAALKQLKPKFGVLLFVLSRFFENGGYLFISVLTSLRSKICIFITRLRFTGKSLLQVALRFCSF